MSLGERCDEIVRLIDETLADLALEGLAPTDAPAPETSVAPRPSPLGTGDRR